MAEVVLITRPQHDGGRTALRVRMLLKGMSYREIFDGTEEAELLVTKARAKHSIGDIPMLLVTNGDDVASVESLKLDSVTEQVVAIYKMVEHLEKKPDPVDEIQAS